MSQIVTAIDTEIEEAERLHDDLRDQLTAAELRVSGLRQLREGAVALNGGVPAASKPKPAQAKPKASKRRSSAKRKTPASGTSSKAEGGGTSMAPSAEDRAKSTALADERQAKVIAYVREHGEIRPKQAAKLLGVSPENASGILTRMVRLGSTPLRRYEIEPGNPSKGVAYRLEMAPSNSEGAKTSVEQRVLDEVKAAQPIDEVTLAFHASMSTNEARSVATGLVRRGVLKSRKEEGTTLYEVA